MGDISYAAFVERGANALDIQFDYMIPGYNDPETGEYFGDTEWNAVITEPGIGSGGVSGYGSESESAYVQVGLPYDRLLHTYAVDFTARNRFSADDVSLRVMIYAAAYAREAQTIVADHHSSIIIGGVGDDLLTGGDADDVLDGGRGSDTLTGGAGADRISGGSGANILVGGEGDDVYTVTSNRDTIVEQADDGYDTVESYVSYRLSAEVERLILVGGGMLDAWGSDTDNSITGNFYANRLWGGGGDDVLHAREGDDIVYGGDGDDLLDGGEGADRLVGGAGDDRFGVDSLEDVLVEGRNAGIDSVLIYGLSAYTLSANIENMALYGVNTADFHGTGNAAANALSGGSGDDVLEGLGADDVLLGGAGDDVLIGGRGADTLDGGGGSNTASYAGSLGAVRINLTLGTIAGADAAGDTFAGIHNLTGGAAGDRLTGDESANVLTGGDGADVLIGARGDDTLVGGAGADVLVGGPGNDMVSYAGSIDAVVVDLAAQTATGGDATGDVFSDMQSAAGGSGGDTLAGDGRDNRLLGHAGDDVITAGAGQDWVEGGAGADSLAGGDGRDTLSYAGSAAAVFVRLADGTASGGDAEGDSLAGFEDVLGSAYADTLVGDDARNGLDGGDGHDTLKGGGGNDVLRGGAGGDIMAGGSGRDTLSYEASSGGVYASLSGNEYFGGDAWGDTASGFEDLTGSGLGDALYGDTGANVIRGEGGNDTIGGYGGDDVLFGGTGKDVFVVLLDAGHVTIMDFDPGGGGEYLEIVLGAAFDTYTEVMAAGQTVGDDVLFTFGADLTVLVKGAAGETFAVDAFVFN